MISEIRGIENGCSNSRDYRKNTFKFAILSLSLITIMAGAGVASGLNTIMLAFPDTSSVLVKMIVSIPSLFMVISALLTGFFERLAGRKTLIVIGLSLFLIGGVGAGLLTSVESILIFRAILGFGTGIILAFSTGLIAACYAGDETEKKRMMGLSFVFNCIGAIFANIAAGLLASFDWRYMFLVYLIGMIPLVMVLVFVKGLPENKGTRDTTRREAVPLKIYYFSVLAMVTMMIFYLVVTNLSTLLMQHGVGGSALSGYMFALISVVMLLGGLLISRIKSTRPIVFFGLLVMAAGLFGLAVAYECVFVFASAVLFGLGLGILYPYLLHISSSDLSQGQSVLAMSIVMASAWMGQFLSPLFFSALSILFGFTVEQSFTYVSGLLLCVTLIYGASSVVQSKKIKGNDVM